MTYFIWALLSLVVTLLLTFLIYGGMYLLYEWLAEKLK